MPVHRKHNTGQPLKEDKFPSTRKIFHFPAQKKKSVIENVLDIYLLWWLMSGDLKQE